MEQRKGLAIRVFPTSLSKKTEFIYVESEIGHGPVVIQRVSDFSYFIVEGSGEFEIDKKIELCKKGDLIVIPAGTPYTYRGKMNIVASSTPPWTAEQQMTV